MPKNKGYRKNLQVPQPGIEYEPEGNGWPVPLTDESNPVRFSYTDGKSGTIQSMNVENVKTKEIPGDA